MIENAKCSSSHDIENVAPPHINSPATASESLHFRSRSAVTGKLCLTSTLWVDWSKSWCSCSTVVLQ